MSIYKFNPMSRQESIDKMKQLKNPLFPKGVYDFKVISSEYYRSEKGNDMIVVSLRLETFSDGKLISTIVKDWLPFDGVMDWKLRHFCDSIGATEAYDKGELDIELLVGTTGKVDIYISKPTEKYPNEKNAVSNYLCDDQIKTKPITPFKQENAIIDDQIPF